MIYIVSRARPHNVQRLRNRWAAMGFDCTVVLDEDDPFTDEYLRLPVTVLQSRYRGVAGARATAVEHAAESGHASIVMSDDDISPVVGSDYNGLLRIATHHNALGVGAFVDYHSFAMKGHLDKLGIPPGVPGKFSGYDRVCAVGDAGFICPSGIAFRMFAINIPNAIKLCNGSGFDPELWCQNEDGEFMRQGIAKLGLPWLLYPQAKATSIGARYVTGGVVSSLGIEGGDGKAVAKHVEVQRLWDIIYDRWPSYVNEPNMETGIRTQWAKMLNDHIPDWREFSALHGADKGWMDR